MSYVEAASAKDGFAVTPSDATAIKADALYVGVTGNVAVVTWRDTTLTFVGVPAGTVIPITCKKVMSTNTTATSIVGLIY
ncbi:MAG: hypothetical protein EOS10_00115 [Mesorhizobium sp.]|uniref:spike base protein, RCAP_Rcc01079 family n=1 Tax=Mesorhizobium sp. TaxID=1871066 RepID=UPI000FE65F87|nr:hypothetical protein [Mesorhizobium sp.]RWO34743.1 MAG: hypothetical protein EOS10_00115 [Mesorhizobium sp.]